MAGGGLEWWSDLSENPEMGRPALLVRAGPPAYSELLWSGLYPNRSGLWYTSLMPTALRLGSLRIVIYPNDHWPAHVHVIGHGHRAVFNLNCFAGPLSLRQSGFPEYQTQSIRAELGKHLADLCKAWEEIHGRA
jgi:hypothetical protein